MTEGDNIFVSKTEVVRDAFTEQVCQHLQQLGIEVFNIEQHSDHHVIELADYGHHLCLYFHKSRHKLYFTPMCPEKILDPSKVANSIQKEFEFELDVVVTQFPRNVVERRMIMADSLKSRISSIQNDWEHTALYVETAKKLQQVLDFNTVYPESEIESEISKQNLIQKMFSMAPKIRIGSAYRRLTS